MVTTPSPRIFEKQGGVGGSKLLPELPCQWKVGRDLNSHWSDLKGLFLFCCQYHSILELFLQFFIRWCPLNGKKSMCPAWRKVGSRNRIAAP